MMADRRRKLCLGDGRRGGRDIGSNEGNGRGEGERQEA